MNRYVSHKFKILTKKLFIAFAGCLVALAIFTGISSFGKNDNTIINLKIEAENLVSPSSPITVELNSTVTFVITTDKSEEIHIEGYHAFANVKKGQQTSLTVYALTQGTFPIILENTHKTIGVLKVL